MANGSSSYRDAYEVKDDRIKLPSSQEKAALNNAAYPGSSGNPFVTAAQLAAEGGTSRFAGYHDPTTGIPTTGTGSGGAIRAEDYWRISTAGTIAGIDGEENLVVDDILRAKVAGADEASEFFGQTTNQDISGKADKVDSATNGNLAGLDANGNLTDSGVDASTISDKANKISSPNEDNILIQGAGGDLKESSTPLSDLTGKTDKVNGATNGNLAGLNGSGELTDSGVAASSVAGKADKISSPTEDNLVSQAADGNIQDSGISLTEVNGKADKPSGFTENHIAVFDAQGNPVDSGVHYDQLSINQDKEQGSIDVVANVELVFDTGQSAARPRVTGFEATLGAELRDIFSLVNFSYELDTTWKIKINSTFGISAGTLYWKESNSVNDYLAPVIALPSNTETNFDTAQNSVKPRVTAIHALINGIYHDIRTRVSIVYVPPGTTHQIKLLSTISYTAVYVYYKL